MSILEKIYEQYIAGELDIKPESISPEIRAEIEKSKIPPEQAEEFEDLILNAAAQYGKEMFFAGFKLAVRFMKEMFAE